MTTIMSQLAQGDLNAAIPDQDRQDEIGKAKAIQVFKVNGEERNRLAAEQQADQHRRSPRQTN